MFYFWWQKRIEIVLIKKILSSKIKDVSGIKKNFRPEVKSVRFFKKIAFVTFLAEELCFERKRFDEAKNWFQPLLNIWLQARVKKYHQIMFLIHLSISHQHPIVYTLSQFADLCWLWWKMLFSRKKSLRSFQSWFRVKINRSKWYSEENGN